MLMPQFSKEVSRRLMSGPGGYPRLLAKGIDKSSAVNGLTGSAESMLNDGIRCLLVGLDSPAEQVLAKAAAWLQQAIERAERDPGYSANETEARRHAGLALCNWLLHDRQDQDNLEQAVVYLDRYLADVPEENLEGALGMAAQIYMDAGAYSRIICQCEHRDLYPLPPDDLLLSEIQSGNEEFGGDAGLMSHVLAQHRLGLRYTDDLSSAAVRLFLPAFLENVLDLLFFEHVARWLKITQWRAGAGLSARDALLKCYGYLEFDYE
jgi:hypothetical protein